MLDQEISLISKASHLYSLWVADSNTQRMPHTLKALLTRLYWEWVGFHTKEEEESSHNAKHWKLNRFELENGKFVIYPDDRLVRCFTISGKRVFGN